ncbi:YmfL family putative regulatory protein [Proteus penneri]|uniref:YmfL family putative regulatory protein n=1 Tax=Proteus penneri TaxID=102862 RepID=UPI00288BDF3C|nr:YmfL family putative regulatory protein [Proteus penneri]
MSNQSIKQVVKEMCETTAGGREAMAGALGLSLTSFNNKLYEKNGCRSFDLNELLAMQDISKTVLFAEFVARESNRLLVDRISPAELDETELFVLRSGVDEMQGRLALLMKDSLADGVIDNEEEQKIKMMLDGLISQIRTFMNAFVSLHQKRN